MNTQLNSSVTPALGLAASTGISIEPRSGANHFGALLCVDNAQSRFVQHMLSKLTHNEREIISLRYGLEDGCTYTQEEVGHIFKITREKVRKIELKAKAKLSNLKSDFLFTDVFSDSPNHDAAGPGKSPCPLGRSPQLADEDTPDKEDPDGYAPASALPDPSVRSESAKAAHSHTTQQRTHRPKSSDDIALGQPVKYSRDDLVPPGSGDAPERLLGSHSA